MPRFAANLTMLYNEHPFLDRFAAAASDGFTAVEYLFPYDYPKEVLFEKLRDAGQRQVLFNLPAGDWARGERGIACLPDRVDEFRAGVEQALDYAEALSCLQVNCLAGIAPGLMPPTVLHRTLVDNLRFAADALGRVGLRLLIEPINILDIPGFYLRTTRQAGQIIEEVGADNLFIQYDFYHMQIAQGDLARTFVTLKDRIGHVQVADNPGRHEPGTGEIGYPFLFDLLDREAYAGWVGCEYRPQGSTSEGLGWLGRARNTQAAGERS